MTKLWYPGGGFDFWPQIGLALAFIGSAYASGFIGEVASEHYNAVKARIKQALTSVKPPRHPDWPDDLPTPQFCGLTMQLKTAKHSFIIDFSIDSLESLDTALDELPRFIESLNSNTNPTHHLILWDMKKWIVTWTQPSNRFDD